jgi:Putative rhamnosyl transferase
MTVPTIDHVILTRFNLPSGGAEARIRASESWLVHRWQLFERYCAPSVAAQSNRNVAWIIYVDPESPEWLRTAIEPYSDRGLFTPVYRAEVPYDDLLTDVRQVSTGSADMLITTNLDNDDGLAVDFIERIQAAVDFSDRRALYLVNGLIKGPDGVYLRRDPDNAFCSVAEPWDQPKMCWADWHLMLGLSMPVVEIGGAPGWLQVVHGENVSNRVRGRLTTATPWASRFPGALDGATEPGFRELARDRIMTSPLRWLRDAGRSTVRRIAITALGKDGMQSLKARLQRR